MREVALRPAQLAAWNRLWDLLLHSAAEDMADKPSEPGDLTAQRDGHPEPHAETDVATEAGPA